MKLYFQALLLLWLTLSAAAYIRSEVETNMKLAWYAGCQEAAVKLEREKSDKFLYNFCIIRQKDINSYP